MSHFLFGVIRLSNAYIFVCSKKYMNADKIRISEQYKRILSHKTKGFTPNNPKMTQSSSNLQLFIGKTCF